MSFWNNSDCTQVQLDIFGSTGLQIKCLGLTVDERTQSQTRISLSTVKVMTTTSWYKLHGFYTPITNSHTLKKLATLVSHNTQMLIHTDRKPHSSRLEEWSPTSVNQQQYLQEKPAVSTEKMN